jgi:hypothetical protein
MGRGPCFFFGFSSSSLVGIHVLFFGFFAGPRFDGFLCLNIVSIGYTLIGVQTT